MEGLITRGWPRYIEKNFGNHNICAYPEVLILSEYRHFSL